MPRPQTRTRHLPPAGAAAGRASRRGRGRGRFILASSAVALLLSWLPAAFPGESQDPPEDLDSGLVRAVMEIRKGFSTSRSEPIIPFVSGASKVYLAVAAIATEQGFYSRDQMQTLLSKAFGRLTTTEFRVRLDRLRGVEEGSEVILCPATWSFHRSGSEEKVRLRLVLSRLPEGWVLKEIREIN